MGGGDALRRISISRFKQCWNLLRTIRDSFTTRANIKRCKTMRARARGPKRVEWRSEIMKSRLTHHFSQFVSVGSNQSNAPHLFAWWMSAQMVANRFKILPLSLYTELRSIVQLTFLQCSSRSILSRKQAVAGVLMLKSVVQRPSSDKCCGWYCWPASQSVAISGSHRGDALCKVKKKTNSLILRRKFTWDFCNCIYTFLFNYSCHVFELRSDPQYPK